MRNMRIPISWHNLQLITILPTEENIHHVTIQKLHKTYNSKLNHITLILKFIAYYLSLIRLHENSQIHSRSMRIPTFTEAVSKPSWLRHLALVAVFHDVTELLDLQRHLEEVVLVVHEPRRLFQNLLRAGSSAWNVRCTYLVETSGFVLIWNEVEGCL